FVARSPRDINCLFAMSVAWVPKEKDIAFPLANKAEWFTKKYNGGKTMSDYIIYINGEVIYREIGNFRGNMEKRISCGSFALQVFLHSFYGYGSGGVLQWGKCFAGGWF
ncbi:MAG: hypothetical protein ACI4VM_06395, partial [Anaerovoracaceae bacterium]